MNPVRRIADDLLEKRLWPIALILVVALVAIPLGIGGGGSPADPGDVELAATPAAAAVETSAPAVKLVGPPAVRTRSGKLRDPFRRTKKAKQADAASKSSGSGSDSPGSSSKQGSSAGASTGGAKPSGGSAKTTSRNPGKVVSPSNVPSLASRSVYEISAHFSGGSYDYEHPLDRLAVLGEEANPALLYLGVSRGGEYAVFLLGPGATAGGDDGACVVADTCRAIGLRKGDVLEVEVAEAGEPSVHYKLELTSLRRVARATRSAAHRERQRVAKGGRAALHAFAEDDETAAALAQLRYGPLTGTVALVRSP